MQFKYLSQLLEQFLFATAIILLCADHLTAAAQLKPAWQQEWEKTLEAAKKEGQVTVYISGYEAVLPHFEKEFPEIKVVAVTGRGNQLGQRLLTERRADKHLADVVSSGANPNYQQFYVRQGARSDQAGADAAGSHRSNEVVSEEASIFRS